MLFYLRFLLRRFGLRLGFLDSLGLPALRLEYGGLFECALRLLQRCSRLRDDCGARQHGFRFRQLRGRLRELLLIHRIARALDKPLHDPP